jgi:hypothetical protein
MTGGEKLAWGLRVGELSVGMAAALPARWELFFPPARSDRRAKTRQVTGLEEGQEVNRPGDEHAGVKWAGYWVTHEARQMGHIC